MPPPIAAVPTRISRLRSFAVRWGPVLAWAALIFALSAQPGLRISADDSVDAPSRHVAHGLVFGVLTLLVLRGLGALGRPLTLRHAVIAGAAALAYAVSDELHQAFVPDRTGQAIDVGYDAVGIAVGLGLAWAWGRWRSSDAGPG